MILVIVLVWVCFGILVEKWSKFLINVIFLVIVDYFYWGF